MTFNLLSFAMIAFIMYFVAGCNQRNKTKIAVARGNGILIESEEQKFLQREFTSSVIKELLDNGYKFNSVHTMSDDRDNVIGFTWVDSLTLNINVASRSIDSKIEAPFILGLIKSSSVNTNIKCINFKLYDYVESVQRQRNGINSKKYIWRNLKFDKSEYLK